LGRRRRGASYLKRLKEELYELLEKLGGVAFTTVDDAVERMRSLEMWPVGEDVRLGEHVERMGEATKDTSRGSADDQKDLLQIWKNEVGFPRGEIENILKLSDPPYYTACPNPFIGESIEHTANPTIQRLTTTNVSPSQRMSVRARMRPDTQCPLISYEGASQGEHAIHPALQSRGISSSTAFAGRG